MWTYTGRVALEAQLVEHLLESHPGLWKKAGVVDLFALLCLCLCLATPLLTHATAMYRYDLYTTCFMEIGCLLPTLMRHFLAFARQLLVFISKSLDNVHEVTPHSVVQTCSILLHVILSLWPHSVHSSTRLHTRSLTHRFCWIHIWFTWHWSNSHGRCALHRDRDQSLTVSSLHAPQLWP